MATLADNLNAMADKLDAQNARIAQLEAALREIDEECPRDYPQEYARACFDAIVEILTTALAPFEKEGE